MGGGTRRDIDFGNTWGSGKLALDYATSSGSSGVSSSGGVAKPVCRIKYEANGGNGFIPPQYVIEGQLTELSDNIGGFVLEDHVILGWNTMPSGAGTQYSLRETIVVEKDLILFAQWIKNGTLPTRST